MKIKRKLVLTQRNAVLKGNDYFVVREAHNTVDFKMGQKLDKAEVQFLIDRYHFDPIEIVIKLS